MGYLFLFLFIFAVLIAVVVIFSKSKYESRWLVPGKEKEQMSKPQEEFVQDEPPSNLPKPPPNQGKGSPP